MARMLAMVLVAFALLAPRLSEACAVCSFSDDGSQRGFMLGTLIMTTLPFLVIGSVVFFVRRRMRSAGQR
jgi:large-conductance mechanosensitive channel